MKVYLQSLGCDKNRVDGEVMLGTLRLAGFEVVNNPEVAVAIIINTCGFIRDAVQESLDAVFELAAYKNAGRCRALIIVGCMAERYKNEIRETIPEADAFIGVKDYEKIADIVAGLIGSPSVRGKFASENLARLAARADSEIPHIAYVKIAEGCDNCCAYCTIPSIRGGYKSRPMEEILRECKLLVEAGAKELVLVAQDTARYGTDLYGVKMLPELLREIAATSGAAWIRLMYVYPEQITPALIDAMAETPQICRYIDMPLQHSEDAILTKMGRRGKKYELQRMISVLRDRVPGIAIRTTLMVGFPGETDENFNNMYDFAEEQEFDRMGAFPYSQEEGTSAAEFPEQVDEETKQARLNKLMTLQQKIHFKKQRDRVGDLLQIMVDAPDEEQNADAQNCDYVKTSQNATNLFFYIGRTEFDAYESDAVVYFSSRKALALGQIVPVKITAAFDYDLEGVAYEPAE